MTSLVRDNTRGKYERTFSLYSQRDGIQEDRERRISENFNNVTIKAIEFEADSKGMADSKWNKPCNTM